MALISFGISGNGSCNDGTSQVMSNKMAWVSLGISFEIN